VRWLGARRVTEFLEDLIRIGRTIDPDVLFSYATYPPTNICCHRMSIFCCFNVYLHNQHDLERYLLRLQNLTDERPLILGEFGMDTIRHSQEEQAEMLSGTSIAWSSAVSPGQFFLLGLMNGSLVGKNYRLGIWIVTRERKPKKAFYALQENLATTVPYCVRPCLARRSSR